MATEMMDRRHLSFFSEEICFPTERHIGLWKPDSVPDHRGTEGMAFMPGSKSVSSSPMEQLHFLGSRPLECLELSQPYIFKGQKTKSSLNPSLVRMENTTTKSRTCRTAEDFRPASDLQMQHPTRCLEGGKLGFNGALYENENALFSSSLSGVFNRTLRLSLNDSFDQHADNFNSNLEDEDPFESLQDVEAQTIGNLLPDDDDLFSGVIDDLDCVARPHVDGDFEDDLFCSGGGMELEVDDSFNCNNVSDSLGGGALSGQQGGLSTAFTGEHPSRTLFVRNINSSVEDAELKDLFEEYGDIRALYTACKHRGFVMISYFDIRAARNAMKALQNKTLRRRKLDIHFSIPKDNPSEKDINQGTLVVFNLDSSVSNEDLCQIFGAYGEIKEIRETPHKRHHKFIEFYDVRSAEAALRALNKSDIAGKKIKLEPSRPGGARRLMQQLCPELEQDETNGCRHGSPPNISPSDYHETITMGMITSNGLDNGVVQGLTSSFQTPVSTFMDTRIHGISPNVVHRLSSPVNVASIGNHASCLVDHNHSVGQINFSFQSMPAFSPHSLPEYHEGLRNGIPCNSPSTMPAMPINIDPMGVEGVDNRSMHRVASGGLNSHSFEHNGTGLGSLGNGSCRLHGRQLFTNNSVSYQRCAPGPMIWSNSPSYVDSIPPQHRQHMHGLPRAPSPMISPAMPLLHHHVGSAPTVKPSIWDMAHVFSGDSADATTLHPGSLGTLAFSGSSLLRPLKFASQNIFPHSNGNHVDPSVASTCIGIPSPQQSFHMFHGRSSMMPMPAPFDSPNERVRSRRSDASGNLSANKRQYELDIDCILYGEDSRTTLMIKNIPNKYTSKMLLAAIDEHHHGTYDFIYLPIDFKNKCNVGYAFINMINPQHIIPFFQAFNGKKWEKFNSEKVASLAYARIQGKAALIAHFQNSSLMNEDKRCRPILFHSDGPNAGDQEPFPIGNNVRTRPGRSRTISNGEHGQGSPTNSADGDETSNLTDSSS
ncbi:putative RNA recognition motif domain, mei2-like RNA recognition, RNA-binding domain superfamily [Dioscorea sansibarensis]